MVPQYMWSLSGRLFKHAYILYCYIIYNTMGFFSWVSKVGKGIKEGVQSVGRAVGDGARAVSKVGHAIKDGINKAYDFTQKIPVVGGLVNTALDMKIPLINVSARDVAKVADKGLDVVDGVGRVADSVARGDIKGAYTGGKDLYQQGRQIGGMVRA